MRIVFLGTPVAAVPSLEALLAAGHEIPLVVTQPDRPVRRSRSPVPSPVKVAALAAGLTVSQPHKVRNAEFRQMVGSRRADLLVVVAYGRILTPKVLALPKIAPINLHFSLLPRYRGAAPVQWMLARGESHAGVSTMYMSEGVDEGDILQQESLPILGGEHAPALEARLAATGAALLVKTVEALGRGALTPRRQDASEATLAPILTKRDGYLDPGMSAQEIEGRIRGFDPWPGAWLSHRGKRVRLVKARSEPSLTPEIAPGTVVKEGSRMVMVCGGGTRLVLEELQLEGRKAMAVRDAVNGRQLEAGECFVAPAKLEH